MTLRAAVIPGIQSTDDDWQPLAHELEGAADIQIIKHGVSVQKMDQETWRERALEEESLMIRDAAADILITHSYGTHRATELLERNPHLQGAVLLTPPRNAISYDSPKTVIHTQARMRHEPNQPMENTLWNLALEMDDEPFYAFAARQLVHYRANRKEVNGLLKFLENGPSIHDRLSAYDGAAPVHVIQAPHDLWHPGIIASSASVSVSILENNAGHYPHVSMPADVAAIIRTWISQTFHMQTQKQTAVEVG